MLTTENPFILPPKSVPADDKRRRERLYWTGVESLQYCKYLGWVPPWQRELVYQAGKWYAERLACHGPFSTLAAD